MLKHVCKYCNKSFPCGSSLGGHMRSHVENGGFDFDDSGYDLARTPEKGRICKECGKGFQSMKALCGHMACHSERGKVVLNNVVKDVVHHDSWEIANQKSETDSHSDTKTGFPRRQRRSKRLRYKKNLVVIENDCVSIANNNHHHSNNNNNGGSSTVSGIEQELEEVAMCLLMLSRDSGNWGGLNYVAESSETNYFDYFDNRSKWEGQNYVHFKNSDSGYFRNETRKIESDVCVNGYFRNGEFKKLKSENNGLRFDVEMDNKGVKRFKKDTNFESMKGLNIYDDDEEEDEENDDYEVKKTKKRSKFECFICNKILSSPQALGGHIASHKKNNNNGGQITSASTYESGENSLETDNIMSHFYQKTDYKYNDNKASVWKNGKKHECPFCFKVFKSGQALGGHKRIHNVGLSEDRSNRNPVVNQELDHEVHDLLDLNWPPPMKD